jgi:hypothetical protein
MAMNLTRLSAIAEITSSIAVLVTLVYLTIEIQQNTQVLEANSRQAALENGTAQLQLAVNVPEIWLSTVNPNLTDSEKVRLSAFLFAVVERGRTNWRQYRAGAMDEASWLDVQGSLVSEMSTLQGRKWWKYFSPEFEKSFREHIDEQLRGQPIRTALPDVRAFD